MKKNVFWLIHLAFFLFATSCVSFEPGWKNYSMKTDGNTKADSLLEIAQKLEKNAATKPEVENLITAYKNVLKANPANYNALWKVGNYHILLGAAYSDRKRDKKHHYLQAVKYCERAMYSNDAFRKDIQNGSAITDASQYLTINEIDAMGYWYTARFYYFKDCLNKMSRVFNTKIVIENNMMIDRIDELDPAWAGGGNFFSRALYYIAVPEKFGGSKARAEEEFEKAIKAGPDYLVNRWGRAKYLYALTGNQAAFEKDLEWVLSQDPNLGGNPYPWNVYFQSDARKILKGNAAN